MPGEAAPRDQASLATVLREWGRIGCIGFGGPPAHIALLRQLCVDRRQWLDAQEFEDAIGACNLLPGPASTELAIFCAWRVRGRLGALVGGLAFIVPGFLCILALSALFLAGTPPLWVKGAGAGAGAAVAAVAVQAGWSLLGPSWTRARRAGPGRRFRWAAYLLAGAAAAATIGPWLVLVLLGSGLIELAVGARGGRPAAAADGTGVAASEAAAAGDAPGGTTQGGTNAGREAAGGRGAAGARGGSRRGGGGGGRRRAGLGGLGGVQGGGAVVRRRLRDHPADAGGRGGAGLDDQRPVPERGGPGPDHPGPGGADRIRRRLRGRGPRRRACRGAGRVLAVVRVRPRRRQVLQRPAHQQERPVVPGWRGPGGDRGDSRLGHPAGRGAEPAVAVRGAGWRGGPAARAEARGRGHPARRRRDRAGCRASRGPLPH